MYDVVVQEYLHNRKIITLVGSKDGKIFTHATTWMHELDSDEFAITPYLEGMLKAFVSAKVVHKPHRYFRRHAIVRLIK